MTKRIYIFVNGILTFPGNSRNWNRRAVTWTHLNTPHRAESLEYLCGALTRPLFQGWRAEKLWRKIGWYARRKWDVVLVGHSNGADVIRDALRSLPALRAEVFLFSPAIPSDMEENGLNALLDSRAIDRLQINIAESDTALALGGTFIGRAFGYGRLGKEGPSNLTAGIESGRVMGHWEPEFEHGSWFTEAEFGRTMKRIHGFES